MSLTVATSPWRIELRELVALYGEGLAVYHADGEAAVALLSVGESPRDESLDAAEVAAWTNVATVLLNLDELITKG